MARILQVVAVMLFSAVILGCGPDVRVEQALIEADLAEVLKRALPDVQMPKAPSISKREVLSYRVRFLSLNELDSTWERIDVTLRTLGYRRSASPKLGRSEPILVYCKAGFGVRAFGILRVPNNAKELELVVTSESPPSHLGRFCDA